MGDDPTGTGESDEGAPSVGPPTLQRRIDAGDRVRVLDLRDRDEVEQWRLAGPGVALTQKPYNRFVQATVTGDLDEFVADVDGEGPVTVVCARGEASAEVAAALHEAGHDAHNLTGGMEKWARLLLAAPVPDAVPASGDGSALVQYRRPASGCLGYAVLSGGEAAVVDPLRAFTDRYVADAAERGVEITHVVDTHVHADHVSGLRDLAEATGSTPVLGAPAVDRGVTYDVEPVADGEELRVGDLALEAVHAPGHTTGMTAFAVGDALLTGDSLFVDGAVDGTDREGGPRSGGLAGVARPDLEDADDAAAFARELHRTLTERFARFPDDTVVAPGRHAEGATPGADGTVTARLGDCRAFPVFETSEAEFVERVTERTPPRPANHESIVAVNIGRESAADDAAFELELGPNNCAAAPADD